MSSVDQENTVRQGADKTEGRERAAPSPGACGVRWRNHFTALVSPAVTRQGLFPDFMVDVRNSITAVLPFGSKHSFISPRSPQAAAQVVYTSAMKPVCEPWTR